MKNFIKSFLLFTIVTFLSAFTTISYADSNWVTQVPSFPSCQDASINGANVYYNTGLHQIAGGSLLQGTDSVFYLSDGNSLQCFEQLSTNTCIQTNWWKSPPLAHLQGWIPENGNDWGLGNS